MTRMTKIMSDDPRDGFTSSYTSIGMKKADSLIANQQAEMGRINALYDAELARLRKLWSGASPGSMGALPPEQAASDPKKTANR